MHVLFISKWYPGRNDPQLGVFIQKHAQAVAQHAQTSVIFAHAIEDQTQEVLVDRQLVNGVLELKAYFKKDANANWLVRKWTNLKRLWKGYSQALQELEAERGLPDLCHVHILTRPLLLAVYLRYKKKIPFIVSEQSSIFLSGAYAKTPLPQRAFVKWAMGKARARTAVSSHLSEHMRQAGLRGQYTIVPNVLPVDQHPLPASGQATEFLMVADLVDEIKNISGVLYALAELRNKGSEAKLQIIGGGPDQQMLTELTTELGISSAVSFHGRLQNNQVLQIMQSTGSVIINSRFETFSVVTGEALMLGKPVIATRCGGPNDLVNASNGFLIPVNDRAALEQAMARMVATHDQFDPATIRGSLGERTSPDSVGQQFMSIYQQAVS